MLVIGLNNNKQQIKSEPTSPSSGQKVWLEKYHTLKRVQLNASVPKTRQRSSSGTLTILHILHMYITSGTLKQKDRSIEPRGRHKQFLHSHQPVKTLKLKKHQCQLGMSRQFGLKSNNSEWTPTGPPTYSLQAHYNDALFSWVMSSLPVWLCTIQTGCIHLQHINSCLCNAVVNDAVELGEQREGHFSVSAVRLLISTMLSCTRVGTRAPTSKAFI